MSLPGLSRFPGQVGQRGTAASSSSAAACHPPTRRRWGGDLLGTLAVLAEDLHGPGRPGQHPGPPRGQGPLSGPFSAVAPLGHPLSSTSKPSGPSRTGRTVQQVVLCDVPALFSRFSRASVPASVAAAPFPSNDHRANHPFPPPFSIHQQSPAFPMAHYRGRSLSHSRRASHHTLEACSACKSIPVYVWCVVGLTYIPMSQSHSSPSPRSTLLTVTTALHHYSQYYDAHARCLTILSPHATIMHAGCQV